MQQFSAMYILFNFKQIVKLNVSYKNLFCKLKIWLYSLNHCCALSCPSIWTKQAGHFSEKSKQRFFRTMFCGKFSFLRRKTGSKKQKFQKTSNFLGISNFVPLYICHFSSDLHNISIVEKVFKFPLQAISFTYKSVERCRRHSLTSALNTLKLVFSRYSANRSLAPKMDSRFVFSDPNLV